MKRLVLSSDSYRQVFLFVPEGEEDWGQLQADFRKDIAQEWETKIIRLTKEEIIRLG